MTREKWKFLFVLLLVMLVLVACGNEESGENEGSETTGGSAPPTENGSTPSQPAEEMLKPEEPVELMVYAAFGGMTDEKFMELYGGRFIQQIHPHISFTTIPYGKGVAETIATGQAVDLILVTDAGMWGVVDAHWASDLTELIKANAFSLDSFYPSTLVAMKYEDQLLGLPFRVNSMILYYNKEIFNKFGVDYPTSGMTWDELYDLAALMTRNVDGVQYFGFTNNMNTTTRMGQFSLNLVDPVTNQATFQHDSWRTFLNNFIRFYILPGYENDANRMLSGEYDKFRKDGNIAMRLGQNAEYSQVEAPWEFDWDMVGIPYFKELPGVDASPSTTNVAIASNSKNREAAFTAIMTWLSESVQTSLADNGWMSPLNNAAIIDRLGSAYPTLQGKNIQALAPANMADPLVVNEAQTVARTSLMKAFNDVAIGVKDLNTALRDAEDEANLKLQELK